MQAKEQRMIRMAETETIRATRCADRCKPSESKRTAFTRTHGCHCLRPGKPRLFDRPPSRLSLPVPCLPEPFSSTCRTLAPPWALREPPTLPSPTRTSRRHPSRWIRSHRRLRVLQYLLHEEKWSRLCGYKQQTAPLEPVLSRRVTFE